jgi:hypothetical protein
MDPGRSSTGIRRARPLLPGPLQRPGAATDGVELAGAVEENERRNVPAWRGQHPVAQYAAAGPGAQPVTVVDPAPRPAPSAAASLPCRLRLLAGRLPQVDVGVEQLAQAQPDRQSGRQPQPAWTTRRSSSKATVSSSGL